MIIDSLSFNGACICGHEHKMQTEFSVISSGCLKELDKYLLEYNLTGFKVAVYDENTYKATNDRHPKVDLEIILNPNDLHANEHGVAALMEKHPQDAKVLIAIGSGTIPDITRYCAYRINAEFVSFCDYKEYSRESIAETFNEIATEEIVAENKNDSASGVTATVLKAQWDKVCERIEKLPSPEFFEKLYSEFGVKSRLCDIGISDSMADSLLNLSPMVRNRLTLMRLRRAISFT